jgi:hypothetical protein
VSEESRESGNDYQQGRIILALLEQPTLERAAAALDMSKATLWRWTQKPEFATAFREARRDAFSQSLARLQHAANVAVNTLLRVMTDREAPAASRVRALTWFSRRPFGVWRSRTSRQAFLNLNVRHKLRRNLMSNLCDSMLG